MALSSIFGIRVEVGYSSSFICVVVKEPIQSICLSHFSTVLSEFLTKPTTLGILAGMGLHRACKWALGI